MNANWYNSLAADVADFDIDLSRSDDPQDNFSLKWINRVSGASGRKTWSSLALVLFFHSALACLLWCSPRPQVPSHKWMEVRLVSLDGDANRAGSGLKGPSEPAAKERAGGSETGARVQAIHEAPSAHPPTKQKKQKDLPAPRKNNIETDAHPKENMNLDPAQSESPANQDLPGKIAGTGEGAAASSGAGPPGGAWIGSGSQSSLERTFGSPDGPSFLRKVVPCYPALAKRLAKEGIVLLRVTIDKQGRPLGIEVLKKAGFGFDEEAVKAIKDSSFVPAQKDGEPLACKVLLPIRFVLKQS